MHRRFVHNFITCDEKRTGSIDTNSSKYAVIGIVKIVRLAERCAAQIQDLASLKEEIHVLESHFGGGQMAIIENILHLFPVQKIGRSNQNKPVSPVRMFGSEVGNDGIILPIHGALLDHEF